jgi:hypothetical protein
MCFDGIFGDDPIPRREAIGSKEDRSNCKDAHAQEPSWHPSLQWLGLILLMFCEFFSRHYGINHKINEKIEGVHLDTW